MCPQSCGQVHYDGRSFREARWDAWCYQQNLAWPRLPSGRLDLRQQTFKDMAAIHPDVQPIKELRASLSQLRLHALQVGPDGRNRCLLSAFRAITSRNQPSTNKFIFGPAVWMRFLIQAQPEYGLAYIDYEQQEFGIAAVLANDTAMIAAYCSADPYLEFAKQAGAAPPDATRDTHEVIRNRFKTCALGVQYGMESLSLAVRLGSSEAHAAELLRYHRRTYPQFWWWSDNCLDTAMWTGYLTSCFGWRLHVGRRPNPRSLRNWPVQTHGAEMLRLACCYATEAGIRVAAPVHDAVLIESPLETLAQDATRMAKYMRQASADVLQGFELRTEVKYFRAPERYSDKRGKAMWETVNALLAQCEAGDITSRARV